MDTNRPESHLTRFRIGERRNAATAQEPSPRSNVLVAPSQPAARFPTSRIVSVDAYRGLVMFLMLAEVFRSCEVFGALPGSSFWGAICFEQTHAAWVGASLHDLIQPSFYFIVGMAVLFSIARRTELGEGLGSLC